jgi:hypothetical protein
VEEFIPSTGDSVVLLINSSTGGTVVLLINSSTGGTVGLLITSSTGDTRHVTDNVRFLSILLSKRVFM